MNDLKAMATRFMLVYRCDAGPVKQVILVDADVLAWFRTKKQYQTMINKALREYMEHHAAPGKKKRA